MVCAFIGHVPGLIAVSVYISCVIYPAAAIAGGLPVAMLVRVALKSCKLFGCFLQRLEHIFHIFRQICLGKEGWVFTG